jgi:hypothetical protein
MNDITKPVTEEELQAKAVAPRVSMERLEGLVRTTEFHRPNDASTLTICTVTTKQGFSVVGESAAAAGPNFDPAIGMRIARQNALNKLWPHEGYLLRAILAASEGEGLERLVTELEDSRAVNGGDLTTADTVKEVLRLFRNLMTEG